MTGKHLAIIGGMYAVGGLVTLGLVAHAASGTRTNPLPFASLPVPADMLATFVLWPYGLYVVFQG